MTTTIHPPSNVSCAEFEEFLVILSRTFHSHPSQQTRQKLYAMFRDGRITTRLALVIQKVRSLDDLPNPETCFKEKPKPLYKPSNDVALDKYIPSDHRRLARKPEDVARFLINYLEALTEQWLQQLALLDVNMLDACKDLAVDLKTAEKKGADEAFALAGYPVVDGEPIPLMSPAWIRYFRITRDFPSFINDPYCKRLREEGQMEIRQCYDKLPSSIVSLFDLTGQPDVEKRDAEFIRLNELCDWAEESTEYLFGYLESLDAQLT